MVVCKFFLQGTCKFGDFCKFEHQINDNFGNYNQNSTSILRQSQFGNAQQQQQIKPSTNTSNVDTNTLVKSVVNDMTVAEKGGQWLLSCYAPFKEKPAFPGFEDCSFEEIRLGYYEAMKNETVDQYIQQVQMMLQQAVMRLKSLQSPSPDIVNILKNIYNTPPSSHCGVYGINTVSTTAAFGNSTNTSGGFAQQPTTFPQQQQSSSMFAQPGQNVFVQPQNQFGGASNSIFGGSSSQNQIFKGQTNPVFRNRQIQAQNANDNIFRQANNSFTTQGGGSIFGGQSTAPQTTTNSIFGVAQPNNNSIFSGSQPTGGSIFGGQQTTASSIFGGQQNAPVFAPPQTQPSSGNMFPNSFTNQNTNNSFGQNMFGASSNAQAFRPPTTVQNMAPQGPMNVFAIGNNQIQPQNTQKSVFAQQQPSVFVQQNAGTVFNQQTPNPTFGQTVSDARSHSNSIFGSSQNTVVPNLGFSQVQQVDESVYSKLEELTEEEIKWFESDDLDISRIPEKPPTLQMCFKT